MPRGIVYVVGAQTKAAPKGARCPRTWGLSTSWKIRILRRGRTRSTMTCLEHVHELSSRFFATKSEFLRKSRRCQHSFLKSSFPPLLHHEQEQHDSLLISKISNRRKKYRVTRIASPGRCLRIPKSGPPPFTHSIFRIFSSSAGISLSKHKEHHLATKHTHIRKDASLVVAAFPGGARASFLPVGAAGISLPHWFGKLVWRILMFQRLQISFLVSD